MNFSELWRTADCDLQNLHRGFESRTRLPVCWETRFVLGARASAKGLH